MQRIVVGVDGSAGSDRALQWAIREAEQRLATIDLVHCYVIHATGAVLRLPDRELADERLDAIIERHRERLDLVKWSGDTIGVFGDASAGIVDYGYGADLLVVGARGSGGFDKLRLGATGYRTAAHAPTPVAVVPVECDPEQDGKRELVVGIDASRSAARALEWAVDEARRRARRLRVVHAYHLPADPMMLAAMAPDRRDDMRARVTTEAERLLTDALARADTSDIDVELVVEQGTPSTVLLAQAGAERLLVVGTHGRGAFGRALFGSVSHQSLHHLTGPVVVVP